MRDGRDKDKISFYQCGSVQAHALLRSNFLCGHVFLRVSYSVKIVSRDRQPSQTAKLSLNFVLVYIVSFSSPGEDQLLREYCQIFLRSTIARKF